MSTAPLGNRAPDLLPLGNPWLLVRLQAKPLPRRVPQCEGTARPHRKLRRAKPRRLVSRPRGRLICHPSPLVNLWLLHQDHVQPLPADSELQSLVPVEVRKLSQVELQNLVLVELPKSNRLVIDLDKRVFLQRYP